MTKIHISRSMWLQPLTWRNEVLVWSLASSNCYYGKWNDSWQTIWQVYYRLRMWRVRRNSRQHDVSPLPALESSDMFSVRCAKSTRSANTCMQSKHVGLVIYKKIW